MMGKNAGLKKRSVGLAQSPMSFFFASSGLRLDSAAEACGVDKMAVTTGTVGKESAEPLTRSEWRAELAGGG